MNWKTYLSKCSIPLFLILLIATIPFDIEYQAFRKFSRTLAKQFELTNLFPLQLPSSFYSTIHYYLSDIFLATLGIVLFRRKQYRQTFLTSNRYNRYLTALFFSCFFSIIFSASANYYYLYFSLLHLVSPFFAFVITYEIIKVRQSWIYWIAAILLSIALFECLEAIGQFITQKSFGLYSRHSLGFAIFPVTKIIKQMFTLFPATILEGQKNIFRANGTFPHPNHLASFLVLSLLLTHYLLDQSEKYWQKISFFLCIVLQIFTLAITFSRAATIGYLLAVSIYFLPKNAALCRISKGKIAKNSFLASKVQPWSRWLFYLLLPLVISFPFLLARAQSSMKIIEPDDWRILAEKLALQMFRSHPILGVGYNCFTFCPGDFSSLINEPLRNGNIHNIYYIFLAETGLFGLLPFLLFLASLIKNSWNKLSPHSLPFFATFLGFLFMGFCDLHFLFYQNGRLLFFITTGLLAATSYCHLKQFSIKEEKWQR